MRKFKKGDAVAISTDTPMGRGHSRWILKAGTPGIILRVPRRHSAERHYDIKLTTPLIHPAGHWTITQLYVTVQYLVLRTADQLPFFEGDPDLRKEEL